MSVTHPGAARKAALLALLALTCSVLAMFAANPAPVAATSPLRPEVTSLSPDHGPSKGGTVVELRGYSLTLVDQVFFGSLNAEIVSRADDKLVVKTPEGRAGDRVILTVTGTFGGVVQELRDAFTYDAPTAPPVVSRVSPMTGYARGNTTVKLEGSGFRDVVSIHFGDVELPAYSFFAESDTALEFSTPEHPAGKVDIRLENLAGLSADTAADDFTVLADTPPAIVTSVTPASGLQKGGQTVTIKGEHLATTTDIDWGNTTYSRGDAVQVISDTEVRVKTPVFGNHGLHTVGVWTAGAGHSGEDDRAPYTVLQAKPSVLRPSRRPSEGGNTVTIVNDEVAWDKVEEVAIASIGLAPITAKTDTSVSFVVPAGVPRTLPIWVRTKSVTDPFGGGTQQGSQLNGDADVYTWTDEPGPTQQAYTVTGTGALKTLAKGTFPLRGTGDLDFTPEGAASGAVTLADANARLVVSSFLPLTATLRFAQVGKATGTVGASGLTLASRFRIKVQRLAVFGAIPLALGNACQTRELSDVKLAGAAFDPATGGQLTSTFAMSDLNGCGALNGLISPLTAGGGNTLSLALRPTS